MNSFATYSELFRIRCRHSYYADGVCRGLSLRPTPASVRMLEQNDCLFRATRDGGVVWYGATNGKAPVLQSPGNWPFSFFLLVADPLFDVITEQDPSPALRPGESIHFFTNAAGILLHPAGESLAQPTLPHRPPRFDLPLSPGIDPSTLKVLDVFGRNVPGLLDPVGPTSVTLDLRRLPSGKYRLTGNANDWQFYLAGPGIATAWGVIDIYPGGPQTKESLPEDAAIISADGATVTPREFTLALETRQTFWRYCIVSQSTADRSYEHSKVTGGPVRQSRGRGEPTHFGAPTNRKALGRDVWCFESEAPLPLLERPGQRYQFLLQTNGGSQSSVALSYATPENTRLEQVNGVKRMCSEIWMYL